MLLLPLAAMAATLHGAAASLPAGMHRFPMAGPSYAENKDFCASKGLRLCTRNEICINGKNKPPVDGIEEGYQYQMHHCPNRWVPIGDSVNDWTQISCDTSTLCKSHFWALGGRRASMVNTDHDYLYCCEGALGGCIMEDRSSITSEKPNMADGQPFNVHDGDAEGNEGMLSKRKQVQLMGVFPNLSAAYEHAMTHNLAFFFYYFTNSYETGLQGTAWGNVEGPAKFTPVTGNMYTGLLKAKSPGSATVTFTTVILNTEGFPTDTINKLRSNDYCALDSLDMDNLPLPGSASGDGSTPRKPGPCAIGTIRPHHDGPDLLMTYYTKAECDSLGGSHYSNGECLKPTGGSYTYDCRYAVDKDAVEPLVLRNADGSKTTFRSYRSCDLN